MADRKITDLTALTTPASADVLPIVDVSEAAAADKNKKITVGELFKGVPDGTAAAPAIAFESDDGNGIFLSTTDTVGIATNGSSRMTVSTTAVTSTLPVIVPDGTAAAPSVAFTGSGTDTGVYSPGVDQVAISTGGSQRLLIQSTGLTVNGTTTLNGTTLSLGAEGGANGFINAPESIYFNIDSNNGETGKTFVFAHNATDNTGTELFRIQDDGKVGLGTSGPQHPLHVVGTSLVTGDAYFGASRGSQTGFVQHVNIEGTDCSLQLYQTTTGSSWEIANDDTGLFRILNGGTDRFDITSSGNVGIGTTSPGTKLEVGGSAAFRTDSDVRLTIGSAGSIGSNDSNYVRAATDQVIYNAATSSGRHSWELAGVEKARIDSSGRLLVGTTSGSGNELFIVKGDLTSPDAEAQISLRRGGGIVTTDRTLGQINFQASNADYKGAWIRARSESGWTNGTSHPTRLEFSTTAATESSPTERMRITSGGRTVISGDTTGTIAASATTSPLLLGASSASTNPGLEVATANTATRYHASFSNPNGIVGTISTNGSATAYNTSSDYRLKENVVPLTGAADRVNQLQVRRFNFIADPDTTVDGFIAHEAQAVVPEAVTGTHDEVDDDGNPVYQGIDQSKLVPLLTAALQEALAEIESLKARVTALEP